MRRRIILASICLVAFLFNLSGCGTSGTYDTDNSLILLISNGESISGYKNWAGSTSWTGLEWISADAALLKNKFSEVVNDIPSITYSDDFTYKLRDEVTFGYLSIYDESFNLLQLNVDFDCLGNLSPGTYYIVINVSKQGKYIRAEKEHESSNYEYAYELVVKV